MAIAFTQVSFDHGAYITPGPSYPNPQQAFGDLMLTQTVLDTDSATAVLGQIYLKPALFLPIGANPEPSTAPPAPYWYFEVDGATPLNTPLDMSYVGPPNCKNGDYTIEFQISGGGFWRWIIRSLVVLLEDTNGYPDSALQNNRRFIYNVKNASGALQNSASSAYNESRLHRQTVWFYNPAANEWSRFKAQKAFSLRYFNSEVLAAPATIVHDFTFELKRSASVVTNLSASEITDLTLRFQTNYTGGDLRLMLWAFRLDANDNSQFFWQNAKADLAVVNTFALPGPLPAPPTAGFLATNEIFTAPSNQPNEAPAGFWTADCKIIPTNLVSGARYRLIAVVHNLNGSQFDSHSFVSPEYRVDALPSVCPPDIDADLSDYLYVYGNNLIVSPQERIKGRVRFMGDIYDACRVPLALRQKSKSIEITAYSLNGGYKHVHDSILLVRDLFGNWVNPTLSTAPRYVVLTEDGPGNWLQIEYFFRVRYEANLYNLATYLASDNTLQPIPLDNQDWTNKRIYLEYKLTIENSPIPLYGIGQDILIFTQQIYCHDYDDNCLDIQFSYPNGTPVTTICDFETQFRACVTNCRPDPDLFIAGIDRNVYAQERFREGESFSGVLPQLLQPPFVSVDDVFDPDACATINVQLLEIETKYRFVAIRKPIPQPTICGQAGVSGGQVTQTYPHDIGNTPGKIRVVCNAYGLADGFELFYPDNVTLVDTTGGLVTFVHILSLDYAPGPGVPTVIFVKVTGTTTGTGWDYFVFCPDFKQPCGYSFTQTIDDEEVVGTPAYLRTAYDILFLGETAGTPNFVFTPQTSVWGTYNFRIAIYYNGVLIYDPSVSAGPTQGNFTGLTPGVPLNLPITGYDPSTGDDFIVVGVFGDNTEGYPRRPFTYATLCTGNLAPTIEQIGNTNFVHYPIDSTTDDDQTITRIKELPLRVDCGAIDFLEDPCDGYNHHLCGTDQPYNQPVCVKPAPDPNDPCNFATFSVTVTATDPYEPNANEVKGGIFTNDANGVMILFSNEITNGTPADVIAAWGDYIDETGVFTSGGWNYYVSTVLGIPTVPNLTYVIDGLTITVTVPLEEWETAFGTNFCDENLVLISRDLNDPDYTDTVFGDITGPDCCDSALPETLPQVHRVVVAITDAPTGTGFGFDFIPATCAVKFIRQPGQTMDEYRANVLEWLTANGYTATLDGENLTVNVPIGDLPCDETPTLCLQALVTPPDVSVVSQECVYVTDNCYKVCPPKEKLGCDVTDLLYFQFLMSDYYNDWPGNAPTHGWAPEPAGTVWLASVVVHSPDCCPVKFSDYVTQHLVGQFSDRPVQQIIINPKNLPKIFYLEFIFQTPGGIVRWFTEPYEKLCCFDNTLLLEGVYPETGRASRDCEGRFYGLPEQYFGTSNFPYRLQVRVPAVFAAEGFSIPSEVSKARVTKKSLVEKFTLITEKIPPYVAERIKSILLAEKILINGNEYLFSGDVNKNNPHGNMWILKLKFETPTICEIDLTCV